jgi:hypothetical protein
MRALVMGRVMVILIRWLFRRGRVLGMAQYVFFEVFDVGTLFLEFLGSCYSHLDKGAQKWYRGNKRGLEGWVGPRRKNGVK